MVKPPALPGSEGARGAPSQSKNIHSFRHLSDDFSAIMGRHPQRRAPGIGQEAGQWADGVEGAPGARSAAIVPETVRPGSDPGCVESELEPLARSLALPVGAPPPGMTLGPERAGQETSVSASSLPERLGLEEAVRRIAWGGDRRRGVARIELGGEHLGTAVVVRGEGSEVSVCIELGHGRDAGSLPERLAERLRARGLSLLEVEVR